MQLGFIPCKKKILQKKVFFHGPRKMCNVILLDLGCEVYYLLLLAVCLIINLYFRSNRSQREFIELSFTSFLVSRNWEQGKKGKELDLSV